MSISSELRKAGPYAGNGVTTVFPFDFKVFSTSDLHVHLEVDGEVTDLALTTDYTATLNTDQDDDPGGSITLLTAPAVDETLVILSNVQALQPAALTNSGGFYPRVIETALDRVTIIVQQLAEKVSRAVLTPATDVETIGVLPTQGSRAGLYLAFDAEGALTPASGTGNDADLRTDLAAANGSTLLGFLQTGSGATSMSVQTALRHQKLTPYHFGATGDGVADDTTALQAALTAAIAQGKELDLLAGVYKVTGSVTRTGGGEVRVANSGGAIIRAAAGSYGDAVLVFSGSATKIQGLSGSVTKGAVSFSQIASTSFAAGDWGSFYDPTDYGFAEFTEADGYGDDRPTYRKGEFFEVLDVSGATTTARSPFYDSYGSGSTDVYKITPVTGYVRGIVVEAEGNAPGALKIDYGMGFEVDCPKLRNEENDALILSRCYRGVVRTPDIINLGLGGVNDSDYGIALSSCQHVRVGYGGRSYGRRHGMMMGNADQVNCVPNRDCVGVDMLITNDAASGVGAADIHGCAEACGYERCELPNGINIAGRAPFVRGNNIQSVTSGIGVLTYELVGGTVDISDNTITCHADPVLLGTPRAPIDFTSSIGPGLVDAVAPRVTNNRIKSTSFSAGTRIVSVQNNGTTLKIDPDVTDNDLLGVNNFGSMLYMKLNSGTAASNRIRVKRNSTSLSGKLAMVDGGTGGAVNAYANLTVLCMPEQQITAAFTTDTGVSSQTSAVQAFRWQYPRAPNVNVGGSDRTFVGSKAVIVSKTSVTFSGASLVISTPDNTNWASALAVNVSATVGLEEV